MAILAWLLGVLGGLCAVMGIITAAEIDTMLSAEFSSMFWLTLGVVLLLSCIAAAISRTPQTRQYEFRLHFSIQNY
jgi:predicted phage tail protein